MKNPRYKNAGVIFTGCFVRMINMEINFVMIHETIGWIGSLSLSICAVPQVYHTYRTKQTVGLSWLFLLLWFFGEVFTLAYILYSDHLNQVYHFPLYFNYLLNTVLVIYLLWAKQVYD